MSLLENMKIELKYLWRQSQDTGFPALRSEFLVKYYTLYGKYKKQIRFIEAMKDRTPAAEGHMRNRL